MISRPAAAFLAVTVLAAGCAGVTTPSVPKAAVPSVPPSLDTSLVTSGGTWAAAVMGGSSAQNNAFWQLFVRPGTSTTWKLVTPPGVATNGGLVLASLGSQALLTGFRPGVDLTFSPLISTRDNGASWSPGSLLDPGLAGEPDALAAAPAGGRLLALLAGSKAEQSSDGGASWTALTSGQSLAAAPAGRTCGLTALTAVSFTPSGAPLLGGTCDHGTVAIMSFTGGKWQAAGPAPPSSLAGQRIKVLRLISTAAGTKVTGNMALLVAGTGTAQSLFAAWSGGGGHWTVSAPLRIGAAGVLSSGFGAAGAAWVILADGQAQTIGGQGAAWRILPALPPGTATLAYGEAGAIDAMAVGDGKAGPGSELTVWRLAPAASAWARTQAISVPIGYGSSGS